MGISTEKEIESDILDYLNAQPHCFAWKVNTMGVFDPVRKIYRKNKNRHIHLGTSDILGIYKAQAFAIECKTPATKNKASDNQLEFLAKVNQVGGVTSILWSLDGAIEFFECLKESMKD